LYQLLIPLKILPNQGYSLPLPHKIQNMNTLAILGFMGLGTTELIVILVVVLLLFGGRKIPEFMKGLGKGIKEFKDASKGQSSDAAPEKKD
jgi:sec-independent protein translocase protein TatA